MKILHVGQMIGGLDIYIRNTVTYADSSIEFVLVHGRTDGSRPIIRMDGTEVREYQIELARPLRPWKDIKGTIQLYRIIKKEKPDLIHCHSAKGGFIGRLVGFLAGVKTAYTPHAFSFLSTSMFTKRMLYRSIERLVRFDSHLLACSDSERFLGRQIIGYDSERCHVWHNAVPDARQEVDQAAADATPIGGHYIVYIGRPSYQKHTLFFIDVVSRVHAIYPNIKFLLLGMGFYSPDLAKLKRKIRDYELEDVVILQEWCDHVQALQKIDQAMFYISTSRYEGLPLSVVEAMSLGKAVVASAVPGNTDCVTNKVNGLLLDLNSITFAQQVCYLIVHPDQVKQYGIESRRIFERDFLLSKQIHELEDTYRQIIES